MAMMPDPSPSVHEVQVSELTSDLTRRRWVFRVSYPYVVFHEYFAESRPTKRHRWRVEKYYGRRTTLESIKLPLAEVPWSMELKNVATMAAMQQLEVLKN